MNIEMLDKTRILISLCDKDLENYSVSFESLDITEKSSRRLLRMLMDNASMQTGVSFRNKSIVIEAMKFEHGCLLLITVSDSVKKRRTYRIKYYNDSYIYVFGDAGSLLSCIAELYRMGCSRPSSSVYLYNGRYYLVINSPTALGARYINMIREFCFSEKKGGISSAVLAEHGKAVALKNAVDTIGRCL